MKVKFIKDIVVILSPAELKYCFHLECLREQQKRQIFPKTLLGGARRSFQREWYQAQPSLEYSQCKDTASYFASKHFPLQDCFHFIRQILELEKSQNESGFASHARFEGHINAMLAWTENKRNMDKNSSMFGVMDKQKRSRWLKISTTLKH